MIYVIGMVRLSPPVALVLSRHRSYDAGLVAAKAALNSAPTATAFGVWVHESDGERNARDLAIVRSWAEDAVRSPGDVR